MPSLFDSLGGNSSPLFLSFRYPGMPSVQPFTDYLKTKALTQEHLRQSFKGERPELKGVEIPGLPASVAPIEMRTMSAMKGIENLGKAWGGNWGAAVQDPKMRELSGMAVPLQTELSALKREQEDFQATKSIVKEDNAVDAVDIDYMRRLGKTPSELIGVGYRNMDEGYGISVGRRLNDHAFKYGMQHPSAMRFEQAFGSTKSYNDALDKLFSDAGVTSGISAMNVKSVDLDATFGFKGAGYMLLNEMVKHESNERQLKAVSNMIYGRMDEKAKYGITSDFYKTLMNNGEISVPVNGVPSLMKASEALEHYTRNGKTQQEAENLMFDGFVKRITQNEFDKRVKKATDISIKQEKIGEGEGEDKTGNMISLNHALSLPLYQPYFNKEMQKVIPGVKKYFKEGAIAAVPVVAYSMPDKQGAKIMDIRGQMGLLDQQAYAMDLNNFKIAKDKIVLLEGLSEEAAEKIPVPFTYQWQPYFILGRKYNPDKLQGMSKNTGVLSVSNNIFRLPKIGPSDVLYDFSEKTETGDIISKYGYETYNRVQVRIDQSDYAKFPYMIQTDKGTEYITLNDIDKLGIKSIEKQKDHIIVDAFTPVGDKYHNIMVSKDVYLPSDKE